MKPFIWPRRCITALATPSRCTKSKKRPGHSRVVLFALTGALGSSELKGETIDPAPHPMPKGWMLRDVTDYIDRGETCIFAQRRYTNYTVSILASSDLVQDADFVGEEDEDISEEDQDDGEYGPKMVMLLAIRKPDIKPLLIELGVSEGAENDEDFFQVLRVMKPVPILFFPSALRCTAPQLGVRRAGERRGSAAGQYFQLLWPFDTAVPDLHDQQARPMHSFPQSSHL